MHFLSCKIDNIFKINFPLLDFDKKPILNLLNNYFINQNLKPINKWRIQLNKNTELA